MVCGIAIPGMCEDKADLVVTRIRQIGTNRLEYGSDAATADNTPKDALKRWHSLSLTQDEFRSIDNNVLPYDACEDCELTATITQHIRAIQPTYLRRVAPLSISCDVRTVAGFDATEQQKRTVPTLAGKPFNVEDNSFYLERAYHFPRLRSASFP